MSGSPNSSSGSPSSGSKTVHVICVQPQHGLRAQSSLSRPIKVNDKMTITELKTKIAFTWARKIGRVSKSAYVGQLDPAKMKYFLHLQNLNLQNQIFKNLKTKFDLQFLFFFQKMFIIILVNICLKIRVYYTEDPPYHKVEKREKLFSAIDGWRILGTYTF